VATIVLASGLELAVTADATAVLADVNEAQRGGADLPAGWIAVVSAEGRELLVQAAQIAYIRP